MPWGIAIGAAVSGLAGYASSQAQESDSKEAREEELKAQKELLEEKRKFDLEDRAYRQGAVGNWAKYAAGYKGGVAPAKDASNTPADPNADPNAAPGGAQPVTGPDIPWQQHPQFAGARPGFGDRAPASLWQQFVPPNGN